MTCYLYFLLVPWIYSLNCTPTSNGFITTGIQVIWWCTRMKKSCWDSFTIWIVLMNALIKLYIWPHQHLNHTDCHSPLKDRLSLSFTYCDFTCWCKNHVLKMMSQVIHDHSYTTLCFILLPSFYFTLCHHLKCFLSAWHNHQYHYTSPDPAATGVHSS